MSADNYSLFYCLSEAGWATIEEGNTPVGWVRIYELKVYQGSPFGRESRNWQQPKTHPDWTDVAADELEKKFPRPDRSNELFPETLKALRTTAH
jgi:hypothetical protein